MDIEAHSCIHNKGVGCRTNSKYNCAKCGWNPEVAKMRLEKGKFVDAVIELQNYIYDDNEHVIGNKGSTKYNVKRLSWKK